MMEGFCATPSHPIPTLTPSQGEGRMPMTEGFCTPQKSAVNGSIASLPFVKGEI
ncbi:MAG: hypothetical protein NT023_05050 [Armatimonadetes bacterium]|nr:hypothetical protein [Armatimonadota bacterium]